MAILPPTLMSPQLDDRLRHITPRHAEMVSNILQRPSTIADTVTRIVFAWLPVMVFGAFVLYAVTTGRYNLFSALAGLACPAVVVTIGITLAFSRRTLANVAAAIPTVLAHGHCGACGYRIAALPTADDGCAVCPECGAAWHSARMIFADRSPGDVIAALRRAGTPRPQSDTGMHDDRGVGLKRGYRWPRPWLAPPLPAHALATAAQLRATRGYQAAWAIGGFWLIWAILSYSLLTSSATRVGEAWTMIGITAAVVGLIHFLISLARLPGETVRAACLNARCCPECWSLLAASQMEFDGLARCPSCRHAWRVIGARQAHPPIAPTVARESPEPDVRQSDATR